jgi:hypothetical protein
LEIPVKQKQYLNKKINDLKGIIRFRHISEQTDFIVVDKDQMEQASQVLFDPLPLSAQKSKSHQYFELESDLKQFVKRESQKIYHQLNL